MRRLGDLVKLIISFYLCGEIIANQKIDRNDDGENDIIIFQTDLKAGETKSFEHKSEESREFPTKTYARFVPERKNDFAWEK